MKEINSDVKKSLFEAINKVRVENGLEAIAENAARTVGNNGRAVGDNVTFTGNINPAVEVKDANGKTTSTYIGVECTDGSFISLASLMGLSSLKGYSTTEKAINISREKALPSSPVTETEVVPEVIEGFDFEAMWKPDSRDLYDEAAILMADATILKGKRATFCGTVVRQIIAKKDAPATAFEQYCKGDKRAMSAKMWKIG